jgi:subfamily B ATP-binding cassette protein MsbA
LAGVSERFRNAMDPWLPRMGQKLTGRQILGGLLFMPILVALRAVADYLGNYFMGWVSERVIRDLRLDVMGKLSALSLDFFSRATTGDLLTRINTDTSSLMRALRTGGADLVQSPMTLLAVLGYLLVLDWKLTLCAFVVLPTCLLPLFVLGKKARRATVAGLKASIRQSSQLVELIASIRVVKAFGLEIEQLERFRKTSAQMVHSGMKGVQAKELVNPIIEIISVLGLGALFVYIFTTERTGKDLASFLAGAALLSLPIKKLAGLHILFEQAGVGVERLKAILAEQPTVREPVTPTVLPEFAREIAFENVTFAFGEKVVLRDFSLKIPRGFRLGLAGESGSGKTTILNLLYRFYDPRTGRVLVDGLDLREVSMRELRQQMALVSQEIVLFDQTVAENIALGKRGATRQEVESAARAAFAHDFILQLPQGYDTRVGERGMTLSGGQRQRIAIARAFVRNAPILVLDEATAALDSKAEGEVQAAIDALAEHRTVICVAHRLSTLASMDRIVVLSEGRIVEQGKFSELMKARGVFASMANRQGIFAAAHGGAVA